MSSRIIGWTHRPRRRLVFPAGIGATDLGSAEGGIGAMANRLRTQWNPTGFYTPADVMNIVGQLGKIYTPVRKQWREFQQKMERIGIVQYFVTVAKNEGFRIDSAWATIYGTYTTAALTAASRGIKYLDAPGLKRAVIGFLTAMSMGVTRYRTTAEEFNELAKPEWYDLVGQFIENLGSGFVAAVRTTGEVIMTIGGVAVDVARAAGNAIMKIPDTISTLLTMVKWGVLIVGGVWVYDKAVKHRSS